MLKVFIGGISVGLANIIPGVSGGTMLVILGLFNQIMDALSGLFSKDRKNLKSHIMFLLVLAVGAGLGIVVFAKLLEILFVNFATQTLFCFVGMVAFSIPMLKRKEMANDKIKALPFLIGCAVIFAICFFAPPEGEVVIENFPAIEPMYLLMMVISGILAGGAMFIPGVSGSMLMLIVGQYYLFKSLVANVTSFRIDILIPLFFLGIGVVVGVVLSSKLTKYCLEKYHEFTMNVILGLVVASSIMLIPFGASYDLMVVITSILTLALGGAIVILLEKLS